MLVRVLIVLAGLGLYLSEWFVGRRLGDACTSNRLLGVEVLLAGCSSLWWIRLFSF